MKRVLLIISLLLFSVLGVRAQDRILVTGTISASVEGVSMGKTIVYAFSSVNYGLQEKDRANAMYEGGYVPEYPHEYQYAYDDGYYEISVPANGYLIFYKFPYKPVCLKVNKKTEINVEIEATQELEESSVTVEGKKKTKKGIPVMHGNKFNQPVYYDFKPEMMGAVEGIGKTNARLVMQAFITNGSGTDTLHYFPPRVYDGEQFHQTQIHWRKDKLYDIAEDFPRLTDEKDSVMFQVTYDLPNQDLYYFKAKIWVEDYIKTYYIDSIEIGNTGRVARPYQFLEYSFNEFNLDPNDPDYYKEPRRETLADAKDMKLQFKQGEAELDESDTATMEQLESLKSEIVDICNDDAAILLELHFEGYASPDGQYAKNADLSDRRTKVVQREVESFRSSELFSATRSAKGYVAPWTDVADLLEKDSLITEAEAIRAIVAETNDMDRQGAQIKKLPYYYEKIVPLLPQLRSVKCTFAAMVKRFLKPEEILEKYQTDSLIRSGRKNITLNEYWNLFNLIDDEKELEKLYIRALAHSKKTETRFWPLPANNLAVMYLKRKQIDTTLLASFIDERYKANQPMTDKEGNKIYPVNADPIVANHVQMFMLAKNYERAEELSSIIENEHPMLRAIVRCLGGYIDFEDPKEEATIEIIKQSSPRNEVIMKLAKLLNDSKQDTTIIESLNKLNPKDPVTPYLRAQHICLKYDNYISDMKSHTFNRDWDPNFSHPKDEIIPAATPEEIEFQQSEVKRIKEDMELEAMYGEVSDFTKNELKTAEETLAVMLKGEVGLKPFNGFSEYDAAKIYLEQCFAMDKKFIQTAKSDYFIAEDLLNDVLGIKKK